MAAQKSISEKTQGSLLSLEQERACQDLVDLQNGLVSQRAAALLGLDSGATQLKAATSSGLTVGQIRYLLLIFRRKGMAIFPVDQDRTIEEKPLVGLPTGDSLIALEGAAIPQPSADIKLKPVSAKDKKKVKGKNKEKSKTEDKGKKKHKKNKKKDKKKKKGKNRN